MADLVPFLRRLWHGHGGTPSAQDDHPTQQAQQAFPTPGDPFVEPRIGPQSASPKPATDFTDPILPASFSRPLNNITASRTPFFGASYSRNNVNTSATSPAIEDDERMDAAFTQSPTPLTTPPKEPEAAPAPNTSNHSRTHQATADDGPTKGTDASFKPTPNASDNRPKLQPKSPQNCHRGTPAQYVRPDYASQVIMEEFSDPNDPMPKGYWGTFAGIRWNRSTEEDYCPCGMGGGHYLVCGHTVISQEPCGANCKTAKNEHEAFHCSQCEEIVKDILANKLTRGEQAKIEHFQKKSKVVCVALSMEYVTKHMLTAKGNIAETVLNILDEKYGRSCLAYKTVEGANEPKTLAEAFHQTHETSQQKTREFLARMNQEPLSTHEKRKDFDDSSSTRGNTRDGAHSPVDTTEAPKVASSAKDGNKKQKTKLETHSEPVTQETRGIKRVATMEDYPEANTLKADAAACANISNKRLKKKLETHREPITPKNCGTKRKALSPDPSSTLPSTRLSLLKCPSASLCTPHPSPEELHSCLHDPESLDR